MLIALLFLLSALLSDDPPSKLAAGDDAFFRMDYPEAVEFYTVALGDHPDDPDILWRLARVYVCNG